MTRLNANLLLLLAAALWGFGNVAQKTVLDHLDPFSAVGLRCLLAAILVAPFGRSARTFRPAAYWLSLTRVAVLFSIAIALQQGAYLETSVSNASFLISTATIMTPLAAWLLVGERPTAIAMLTAAASTVGIALIAGELGSASRGDLVTLLSAVCYALWMVELGRHMQMHGDAVSASVAQFLLAALLTLPVGAAKGTLCLPAIVAAVPELVVLGVFSTAFAFVIQTVAQRYTSASHAAVIVSAECVFGAAGATLFLGEQLSASAALGASVVLAAIFLLAVQGGEPAGLSPTVPKQKDI